MDVDRRQLETTTVEYNRKLHRVALVVAWAVFPLIFIGGLVTSKDAGLSVPDWPNSYGYNMFLFPPRLWSGGIFYEHTHRLYASLVGLLTIVLAACSFTDKRRWVRYLGVGCLGMVVLQGVLGGLRVVLLKLDLAIVHACVAQAFFCMVVLMSVVTSRWWVVTRREADGAAGRRLVYLAVTACGAAQPSLAGERLTDAVRSGDAAAVKALLKQGASGQVEDADGRVEPIAHVECQRDLPRAPIAVADCDRAGTGCRGHDGLDGDRCRARLG